MPSNSLLRTIFVVAIGALVYYALLRFVYSETPYTSMPQWWQVHAISKRGAIISWFTLLNVAGAVLSAIPVAIGMVFISKVHRISSAIIVGVLAALLIVIGGFGEYGLPDSGVKWCVELAQLLSIGGAVVGVVALIVGRPSNISLERARTLKVSSRPFIVTSIMFGAIELLMLSDFIRAGSDSGLIVPVLTIPCCYAVWLALIYSVRVTVSEQEITLTSGPFWRKSIPFADIDHSEIQILAERDWPVSITIYGAANSEPLARIGLKAIQKSDAEWLCALPALRAVVHPGLNRARSNKSPKRTSEK